MAAQRATPERLAAFSDAIFAVIITIMVLDLRPPTQPTLAALLPLWPAALSYAVSYLFIAIIWVNHHHLLRFTESPTPRMIWVNFAHLFMVSLVPFSTAWVADTKLAAVPVFRLCSSVCTCQPGVYPVRVARVGFGASGGDFGPDATIRKNPLVIHIGDLRYCDAGYTEVSFAGLWVDLLRFAGLSAARKPWIQMKMRATLKPE